MHDGPLAATQAYCMLRIVATPDVTLWLPMCSSPLRRSALVFARDPSTPESHGAKIVTNRILWRPVTSPLTCR